MKLLLTIIFLQLTLLSIAQSSIDEINVFPDQGSEKVSPLLFGFNLSYEHDRDSLRQNPKYLENLKGVKAGLLRYPGGSKTSYYHWDFPGAPLRMDIYHPEAQDSTSKYFVGTGYLSDTSTMDTDDYIKVCRELGAEPLLGINIKSGLKFDRVEAGLDEAIRWVKYCKEKNYNVKYWYLDNEVNHFKQPSTYPITLEQYAEQIKLFSPAIKKIDPDAQIIVNIMSEEFDGPEVEKIIDLAGDYFDVLDVHYYWAWGEANWDKWINENPMSDKPQEIEGFYKLVQKKGKDIKLACLEWNIPPHNTEKVLHSDYQHALMQAELFQQFLQSQMAFACQWPYLINSRNFHRGIVSQQTHFDKLPFYYIMEKYGESIEHIKINTAVTNPKMRAFSVMDENSSTIRLFLINKEPKQAQARVNLNFGTTEVTEALCMYADDLAANEMQQKAVSFTTASTGTYELTLIPYSFYYFVFKIKK